MGASGPLGTQSPVTVTCHLFSVALVVTWGADWAALFNSCISPDVMGLSSSAYLLSARMVSW